MPTINTPASGHHGPAPIPGGHQYLPYTDPHFLSVLRSAIFVIRARITAHRACNDAFRALPGGRTLAQVFQDPSVWINFDPSRHGGDFGATRGKDVTITAYSLAMGRWTAAATLVHEMAHVNGASGATHDAEATLRQCLLQNLEDPTIIGQIVRSSSFRVA